MSATIGPPEDPAKPPPFARWSGATPRERSRHALVASLVALAGLALLTGGPAVVALGWHGFSQLQARGAAESQLGVETRDGPVSFVVQDFRCGPEDGSVNGKLCRVWIAARNDGTAEVTVPGTVQRLHGPEGARHLPAKVDRTPFGTLEPGQTGTALITFDLPALAPVTHLEMHADPYSPGATIAVGEPRPLSED